MPTPFRGCCFLYERGEYAGECIDAPVVLQALPCAVAPSASEPTDQVLVGCAISFYDERVKFRFGRPHKKNRVAGGSDPVGFTALRGAWGKVVN